MLRYSAVQFNLVHHCAKQHCTGIHYLNITGLHEKCQDIQKLDGVGPVDNRPSTD